MAGLPEAPPVVSPITVTLGNVRMAATKLSVALKPAAPGDDDHRTQVLPRAARGDGARGRHVEIVVPRTVAHLHVRRGKAAGGESRGEGQRGRIAAAAVRPQVDDEPRRLTDARQGWIERVTSTGRSSFRGRGSRNRRRCPRRGPSGASHDPASRSARLPPRALEVGDVAPGDRWASPARADRRTRRAGRAGARASRWRSPQLGLRAGACARPRYSARWAFQSTPL